MSCSTPANPCAREIAAKCERGKRSILPGGSIRIAIEWLVKVGRVLNNGTRQRPRYSLERNDSRAQALIKMYDRVRLAD